MSLFDDIWTITEDKARYRSRSARISSAIGSKIHKWKKPGNLIKTTGSVAGVFIPIPGASIGTDWVVQKTTELVRGKRRAGKRRAEKQGYITSLEKQVKHGIKNIDASELDRARFKAHNEVNKFNSLMKTKPRNVRQCKLAFDVSYRFHRARHRIDQLSYKATALKVLANEIIDWCDELNESFDGREPEINIIVSELLEHEPEECEYSDANVKMINSKTNCFNSTSRNIALQNYIREIEASFVHLPPIE